MRWCVGVLGLCGCDAMLLLALSGCDVLFGIDSVSPGTPDAMPDASIDASRITVSGLATRRWLYESGPAMPVLEPVTFSDAAVTIRHADGTTAMITWDASGAFSFDAAMGERYSVVYPLSYGLAEFQVATPMVAVDDVRLGHPDETTPGATAAIEWDTSDTTLTTTGLTLATLGIWSHTTTTAVGTGTGRFSISLPAAAYFGGQASALLRAPAHDSAFVLHYTNTTGPPATQVLDEDAPLGELTTAASGTTTVSSNLATLPRPYCVDLYWDHVADRARLLQAYPSFGSPTADARLYASARASDVGFRTPYSLYLLGSGITTSHAPIMYANPFGLDVVLVDQTSVVRTPSTGGNVTATVQYMDVVTQQTSCVRHDNPPSPPLPVSPMLAGVPLVDNVVVGIGTQPVPLRWTYDTAGASPPCQVSLFTNGVFVHQYFTVDNTVVLDPSDLQNNTPYRVQIVSLVGSLPNATQGDFRTRAFPIAFGIVMTGNFMIAK